MVFPITIISSNRRRVSNKSRTILYSDQNKRRPLLSASLYKRSTSTCSAYQKSVHNLTVISLERICKTQREKCPNMEFFLVVFSRIRTEYGKIRSISPILSPNAGKHRPEKTPYLDTFHSYVKSIQTMNKKKRQWQSFETLFLL